MYKFIIKDIAGNIRYSSPAIYNTPSSAQRWGHKTKNKFYTNTELVEVIKPDLNQSVIAHTKSHFNC